MKENLKLELKPKQNTECESIELEIVNGDNETNSRLDEIDELINNLDSSIDSLTNHSDKLDYSVAIASGILTSLIDMIFVGETDFKIKFDINSQKDGVCKDFEKVVKETGKKAGYTGDKLKGAIAKNEKTYRVPQDNVWKGKDIGISGESHHVDDYAHHPTPVGLLSAIISEVLRVGIFQNKDGELHIINIETTFEERIQKISPAIISGLLLWVTEMAEEKRYDEMEEIHESVRNVVKKLSAAPLAIQVLKISKNWIGHLISDMHGSSGSAGAGMGIPGIFVSLLKEISMMPGIDHTNLPQIVNDLYVNKRVDLRTEIMFTREAKKAGGELITKINRQALTVIINELLVRSFYFIRHLAEQLKDKKTFNEVDWNNVIPFNNRTIQRMMTISTAAFWAVDSLDAVVEGAIHSKGSWAEFGRQLLLRVNFVGASRFTVAIGTDFVMGVRKDKKEKERMLLKAESLYLMDAKLYYGERLMWTAAADAQKSIDTLHEAMNELRAQMTDDMASVKKSMDEIDELDVSKINENNRGLADEILGAL